MSEWAPLSPHLLFLPEAEWPGPVKSIPTSFLFTFVEQWLLSNIWASYFWDRNGVFAFADKRSFLGGNEGKPQAYSLAVKR